MVRQLFRVDFIVYYEFIVFSFILVIFQHNPSTIFYFILFSDSGLFNYCLKFTLVIDFIPKIFDFILILFALLFCSHYDFILVTKKKQ